MLNIRPTVALVILHLGVFQPQACFADKQKKTLIKRPSVLQKQSIKPNTSIETAISINEVYEDAQKVSSIIASHIGTYGALPDYVLTDFIEKFGSASRVYGNILKTYIFNYRNVDLHLQSSYNTDDRTSSTVSCLIVPHHGARFGFGVGSWIRISSGQDQPELFRLYQADPTNGSLLVRTPYTYDTMFDQDSQLGADTKSTGFCCVAAYPKKNDKPVFWNDSQIAWTVVPNKNWQWTTQSEEKQLDRNTGKLILTPVTNTFDDALSVATMHDSLESVTPLAIDVLDIRDLKCEPRSLGVYKHFIDADKLEAHIVPFSEDTKLPILTTADYNMNSVSFIASSRGSIPNASGHSFSMSDDTRLIYSNFHVKKYGVRNMFINMVANVNCDYSNNSFELNWSTVDANDDYSYNRDYDGAINGIFDFLTSSSEDPIGAGSMNLSVAFGNNTFQKIGDHIDIANINMICKQIVLLDGVKCMKIEAAWKTTPSNIVLLYINLQDGLLQRAEGHFLAKGSSGISDIKRTIIRDSQNQ